MEEEQDYHNKKFPTKRKNVAEEAILYTKVPSKHPRLGHASSSSFPAPSAALGCLDLNISLNSIGEANAMCSAPSQNTGSNPIQPVVEQFPKNEQWRLDPFVGNNHLQPASPHPRRPRGRPPLSGRPSPLGKSPTGYYYQEPPISSHSNCERNSQNISSQVPAHHQPQAYPTPIYSLIPEPSSNQFIPVLILPVPLLLSPSLEIANPRAASGENQLSVRTFSDQDHHQTCYGEQPQAYPIPGYSPFVDLHDPLLLIPSQEITNPCAASGASQSLVQTFGHQKSYGEQQPRQTSFVSQSAPAPASGTQEMNSPAQDGTATATTAVIGAQNDDHGSSDLEGSSSDDPLCFLNL